ncbi:MAG: tRNA lysidine(34) synthetase TilS [Bacillota bacterium]|nr:tRNA lysidine(34) synthetase TilS [Bacillota bacterium]
MLEEKVEVFLARHSFTLENKQIVVAVSGGPDSLALLYYLFREREKRNLSLIVAHVDHMLRGEESYKDALFVKRICDQLSVPFEMAQINVPELMEKTGDSVEVAARNARYEFFMKVMKAYNYSNLALAHHGDDQVETILMRLTRGSTGKSRAGIPFLRNLPFGILFRPFLNITKKEIMKYCEEHALTPRLDVSNNDDTYTRNRFRKEVLPFLKSENRKVHEHFQRFSEELQSDETFLQELTLQSMNTVVTNRKRNQVTIDIKSFLQMPLPLQRRGIQLILNYLYNERPSSLSAIHIDQIFSLIHHQNPSGKLDFPNKLKVIRSYQQCHFQFGSLDNDHSYLFELNNPGMVFLPNLGNINMEYIQSPSIKLSSCVAVFNASKVQLPLLIRTRKNGDRMSLKGMKGTKKLKDIFIDSKVPIQERKLWPVVTDCNGTIIWLPCLKKSIVEGWDHSEGNYIQLTYNKE